MAHQDIRRLSNELDAAKSNNQDPCGMLQTNTIRNQLCIYFFCNSLNNIDVLIIS